jgi:hypothetical protein
VQDGSVSRAVALTVLLWPACAAGGFLGAVVGVVAGAIGDQTGGWAALGWAFVGSIVGVAAGAGLLGWIWAVVCHRRRLMPAFGLLVLLGIAAVIGLPTIVAVPGSSNDALRIAVCCAIVVVVTALTFVLGRLVGPRPVSVASSEPART